MGAPGAFALAARKGTAAPGTSTGVTFVHLYDPVLDKNGDVAFQALLGGTGISSSNNLGIWAGKPGGIHLIARTGLAAPGAASGVKFSSFVSSTMINSRGQVPFLAHLIGSGITSAKDMGIWMTSGQGVLTKIALEGSVFPLNGKTISTVNLVATPAGGEDGRMGCSNGAGQVVFYATFTDNSQGLFIATLP